METGAMKLLAKTTGMEAFNRSYESSFQVLPSKGLVTIHQKSLFLVWIASAFLTVYEYFYNSKPVKSNDSDNHNVAVNIPEKPDGSAKKETVTRKDALLAVFSLGFIMNYFFICDYLHFFPKADRVYSRDLFSFLCIILVIAAVFLTGTKPSGPVKLLNRHQTEEWKGWMQIMFVWYHYFRAAETYNAVRVYIAAYVWMTGFGNFSFFWVRKDYSLRRVLKVLFRLNFLIIIVVLVTDNQYMLYYICAMHTFWFVSVYMMMRPFHEHNTNARVMCAKFAIYFLVAAFIFDVPGVAERAFAPFSWILSFGEPPSLHEWIFRSGLDHYATFVGMVCAYFHPRMETLLEKLYKYRRGKLALAGLIVLSAPVLVLWYHYVFQLGKFPYNVLHPYTSFIPILLYIFYRNCTPWLRSHHCMLFAYLGKITLETYISQLHVYLQNNAKDILVYLPHYPLVNFLLNTAIYLCISHILFKNTCVLNEYLFPANRKEMVKRLGILLASISLTYGFVATFSAIQSQ